MSRFPEHIPQQLPAHVSLLQPKVSDYANAELDRILSEPILKESFSSDWGAETTSEFRAAEEAFHDVRHRNMVNGNEFERRVLRTSQSDIDKWAREESLRPQGPLEFTVPRLDIMQGVRWASMRAKAAKDIAVEAVTRYFEKPLVGQILAQPPDSQKVYSGQLSPEVQLELRSLFRRAQSEEDAKAQREATKQTWQVIRSTEDVFDEDFTTVLPQQGRGLNIQIAPEPSDVVLKELQRMHNADQALNGLKEIDAAWQEKQKDIASAHANFLHTLLSPANDTSNTDEDLELHDDGSSFAA